ncbi:hypothetical protein ERO13_D09G051300v2 [Gossypium hirsutum]|uniref:Uncharacterized protein isoform X1 n=1 Tax=Gossypium hirsutum TaxID=3635 RepID=A0A1U8I2E3_GOSHI|nr:uncharacterized protein LOC107891980 isoform X1 [Gossypium hirsutum]KAG4128965.1 hypothetical protein ERO13_D09G051300v2 [Gossypium hirsutum]
MMLLPFQSILHFDSLNPSRSDPVPEFPYSFRRRRTRSPALTKAAFKRNVDYKNDKEKKPNICTADELHYVHVDKSEWKVALWRYLPSPQAPTRNHPLMLLSGVGTNAIAYDLSPESSFARFMCGQGYDTWILELRGAGLSTQGMDFGQYKDPLDSISQRKDFYGKGTDYKSFSETEKRYAFSSQITDLVEKLVNIIEEAERSSPVRSFDMQNSISTALKDMQKQLDLISKYDWDFDNYLEEDVPAAMEYIKDKSEPKDGKLLAIGHSMRGILLYAMLSRCGKDSRLAAVTTLASSLDYMSSRLSLKLLLPLADPAQVLNVPVIPIGTLLAAAHPFAANPPYLLSWLSPQISAPDMLQPKLFEKLVTENFETMPAKLLLQLATAFEEGGLRDRSGTFFYKNHLSKSNVPVLAIAGDQDLICPPDAVYETVKLIREPLVTYKVFGEPGGPHFAHYDIVVAQRAVDLVYPCIIEFLNHHDAA